MALYKSSNPTHDHTDCCRPDRPLSRAAAPLPAYLSTGWGEFWEGSGSSSSPSRGSPICTSEDGISLVSLTLYEDSPCGETHGQTQDQHRGCIGIGQETCGTRRQSRAGQEDGRRLPAQ